MRTLWEWFQARAAGRHAKAWLVTLSFTESSFFLIPPDALLMPMLAAGAGRWIYLATITTLASIAGALFGYALGFFVFEPIVEPLITFYHLHDEFAHVGDLYAGSTFMVVFLAAFTPIPFKVFVLAGGFFAVPFAPFMLGSAIGRSMRFFLVAFLSHRFGPRAAELFLTYFNQITLVLVLLASVAAFFYFDVYSLLL